MGIIELSDVEKQFKMGSEMVTVLKKTNLVINQGEFDAIVGPSGSGKSTLLTIIGALQKPTEGIVKINDRDIATLKAKKLSELRFSDIGFVLQASNLVPYLTVKEQFELKYKVKKIKRDKKRIQKMLDDLSITHLASKYPEDISGGERQRVAIGLALLMEPKLILADEPTASLDTEKAYEVIDIFKTITDETNTTVIMVTHDLRMLKECDRVLEMKDGVLTEKE